MSRIIISPEVFWQVYSAKLNELNKVKVDDKCVSAKQAYCGVGSWTPFVMSVAEATGACHDCR